MHVSIFFIDTRMRKLRKKKGCGKVNCMDIDIKVRHRWYSKMKVVLRGGHFGGVFRVMDESVGCG